MAGSQGARIQPRPRRAAAARRERARMRPMAHSGREGFDSKRNLPRAPAWKSTARGQEWSRKGREDAA